MSAFVYVLAEDGGRRTYVGWTIDLERRLTQHNGGRGGARTTRGARWRLVYAERYEDRIEAMRREWQLKRDRAFRAALRSSCINEDAEWPFAA